MIPRQSGISIMEVWKKEDRHLSGLDCTTYHRMGLEVRGRLWALVLNTVLSRPLLFLLLWSILQAGWSCRLPDSSLVSASQCLRSAGIAHACHHALGMNGKHFYTRSHLPCLTFVFLTLWGQWQRCQLFSLPYSVRISPTHLHIDLEMSLLSYEQMVKLNLEWSVLIKI